MAARQAEVRDVATFAAQQLGATAIWTNDVAAIDVRLLLGELLVDTSRSHILFDAHGLCVEFQVSLLVNVAREIGRRPDLIAGLDEQGLHLPSGSAACALRRWRGSVLASGRGTTR